MTVHKCDEKFNKGTCTVYTKWSSEGCKEMAEKKGTLYRIFNKAGGTEESCPLKPVSLKFLRFLIFFFVKEYVHDERL